MTPRSGLIARFITRHSAIRRALTTNAPDSGDAPKGASNPFGAASELSARRVPAYLATAVLPTFPAGRPAPPVPMRSPMPSAPTSPMPAIARYADVYPTTAPAYGTYSGQGHPALATPTLASVTPIPAYPIASVNPGTPAPPVSSYPQPAYAPPIGYPAALTPASPTIVPRYAAQALYTPTPEPAASAPLPLPVSATELGNTYALTPAPVMPAPPASRTTAVPIAPTPASPPNIASLPLASNAGTELARPAQAVHPVQVTDLTGNAQAISHTATANMVTRKSDEAPPSDSAEPSSRMRRPRVPMGHRVTEVAPPGFGLAPGEIPTPIVFLPPDPAPNPAPSAESVLEPVAVEPVESDTVFVARSHDSEVLSPVISDALPVQHDSEALNKSEDTDGEDSGGGLGGSSPPIAPAPVPAGPIPTDLPTSPETTAAVEAEAVAGIPAAKAEEPSIPSPSRSGRRSRASWSEVDISKSSAPKPVSSTPKPTPSTNNKPAARGAEKPPEGSEAAHLFPNTDADRSPAAWHQRMQNLARAQQGLPSLSEPIAAPAPGSNAGGAIESQPSVATAPLLLQQRGPDNPPNTVVELQPSNPAAPTLPVQPGTTAMLPPISPAIARASIPPTPSLPAIPLPTPTSAAPALPIVAPSPTATHIPNGSRVVAARLADAVPLPTSPAHRPIAPDPVAPLYAAMTVAPVGVSAVPTTPTAATRERPSPTSLPLSPSQVSPTVTPSPAIMPPSAAAEPGEMANSPTPGDGQKSGPVTKGEQDYFGELPKPWEPLPEREPARQPIPHRPEINKRLARVARRARGTIRRKATRPADSVPSAPSVALPPAGKAFRDGEDESSMSLEEFFSAPPGTIPAAPSLGGGQTIETLGTEPVPAPIVDSPRAAHGGVRTARREAAARRAEALTATELKAGVEPEMATVSGAGGATQEKPDLEAIAGEVYERIRRRLGEQQRRLG